jgi:O-antigen/teichoic acid export membrane protein
MRQTLKRLTRMTAGYGMVQWAGPFLSVLLMPIITRILDPADYGVTDYLMTVSSAVGTVAALALPQALTAHYNDREDAAWKRQVVGSALTGAVPLALIAGIALALLAPQITQATFGSPKYVPLLQLIGATFVFGTCGSLLTAASQADLRVRWGMALSLANIACVVAGNVLFIIVLRLGVTGMILTPVTTGIVTGLLALILARSLVSRPSVSVTTLLLRSGLVLLPTMVASWMLQVVDRLFLINYVSTTELGYYSIATKIASLVFVALAPLNSAWTPLALAMQHDPAAGERYGTMARYLFVVALGGSLALGLFATEILIVLARPAYLPSAPYVGFLVYPHVFGAIGTTLYIGAVISKKLKAISASVIAGAAINLALNFLLIPAYGVWGATVATVISSAAPTALLYWWIRPYLPGNYPMRLFVVALAVQCVLLSLGLLIPPMLFPLRVGLKLAILALLPASFVLIGIITPFERRQGWLFVRHQVRQALARRSWPPDSRHG